MSVPLKPSVAARLKAAGCPDSVLRKLECYTKMAAILNGDAPGGCSNPVSAYATFAKRNPEFSNLWMPERMPKPASRQSSYSARCKCGNPISDLDDTCPSCGFNDFNE